MALLVAIGYILGCITPPSGAAGAQREEYIVMGEDGNRDHMDARKVEAVLNEYAKQGWRFRALQSGNYYIIMAR